MSKPVNTTSGIPQRCPEKDVRNLAVIQSVKPLWPVAKSIVETYKNSFMVVRIRFGPRPHAQRRKAKLRFAAVAGGLLTLISISCVALALWKIGNDLGVAAGFIYTRGPLSYSVVWIAAAVFSHVAGRLLTHDPRIAHEAIPQITIKTGSEAVRAAVNTGRG